LPVSAEAGAANRASKEALVEGLFARHSGPLHAFFYRRVRRQPDAAELAQEVYARMLRTSDTDVIRNPGYEQIDREQRARRLREVLRQLTPKCRAAVVLRYWHGMTHVEIAVQLGISTHMVKKYLSRALAHCRRRVARMDESLIARNRVRI
jgi:RNA polymerase sigma-70 factor (ECF subfamily)